MLRRRRYPAPHRGIGDGSCGVWRFSLAIRVTKCLPKRVNAVGEPFRPPCEVADSGKRGSLGSFRVHGTHETTVAGSSPAGGFKARLGATSARLGGLRFGEAFAAFAFAASVGPQVVLL